MCSARVLVLLLGRPARHISEPYRFPVHHFQMEIFFYFFYNLDFF